MMTCTNLPKIKGFIMIPNPSRYMIKKYGLQKARDLSLNKALIKVKNIDNEVPKHGQEVERNII